MGVMTVELPSGLDDEAAADARREALDFVARALEDAVMAGLDGDFFAHAAIFAAFQELVGVYGEEAVASFAQNLPQRIRNGEFTIASRH
jgi:hypothetical protein